MNKIRRRKGGSRWLKEKPTIEATTVTAERGGCGYQEVVVTVAER